MKSSTKTAKLRLLSKPIPSDVGCHVCPMWVKGKRGVQWDGSLPNSAVPPAYEAPGGLMFVGEAPGGVEVDEGIPMVGPAGRIARAAIKTLKLPEPTITNTVLCRPMKGNANRAPNDREMRACSYWLEQAIAKAAPKVIVAMGNGACLSLLGREGIHALRGCIFRYKDYPIFVVPTWHPSYVMRAQHSEFLSVTVPSEFLTDLEMAKELMDYEVPANPAVTPDSPCPKQLS